MPQFSPQVTNTVKQVVLQSPTVAAFKRMSGKSKEGKGQGDISFSKAIHPS